MSETKKEDDWTDVHRLYLEAVKQRKKSTPKPNQTGETE